ncbi:MAG: co-chaperone GroES, partial [Halothiobacillaceae bacterium]|nr:co-chaperone GroES [Halothiobacillaceae bacterium]
DSAAEKPNRGEVIAAGPGKSNEKGEIRPMGVSVGDLVLFGQYAGTKVKVDGEDLLMMGEDDILAVIEK